MARSDRVASVPVESESRRDPALWSACCSVARLTRSTSSPSTSKRWPGRVGTSDQQSAVGGHRRVRREAEQDEQGHLSSTEDRQGDSHARMGHDGISVTDGAGELGLGNRRPALDTEPGNVRGAGCHRTSTSLGTMSTSRSTSLRKPNEPDVPRLTTIRLIARFGAASTVNPSRTEPRYAHRDAPDAATGRTG